MVFASSAEIQKHLLVPLWLLVLSLIGIMGSTGVSAEGLTISTESSAPPYPTPYRITVPENSDPRSTNIVWNWVASAYRHLGIEVIRVDVPLVRAYQLVDKGQAEAALAGLPGKVKARFPDLVEVPVPLFTTEYNAYGRDPSIVVEGWDSLQNTHVVTLRGFTIVGDNVPVDRITWANDPTQLLEMLRLNRVKVAVGLEYQMARMSRLHPSLGLVKLNDEPLTKFSIMHIIHSRNAHLLSPLTDALIANKPTPSQAPSPALQPEHSD